MYSELFEGEHIISTKDSGSFRVPLLDPPSRSILTRVSDDTASAGFDSGTQPF